MKKSPCAFCVALINESGRFKNTKITREGFSPQIWEALLQARSATIGKQKAKTQAQSMGSKKGRNIPCIPEHARFLMFYRLWYLAPQTKLINGAHAIMQKYFQKTVVLKVKERARLLELFPFLNMNQAIPASNLHEACAALIASLDDNEGELALFLACKLYL